MAAAYCFRLAQFPQSDDVLKGLERNVSPTLVARIVDEPDSSMYGLRARAKIIATCASGVGADGGIGESCADIDPNTYVQLSYSKPRIQNATEVEAGDVVTLTGTIREMSFSPEQESLKNFFKKEKTYYEIKSVKISHIEKPRSLKRRLIRLRKLIEKSIADALPRPHSDLAQGLVVSGKGSMSKDLLEKFKRVGLIHIVVLSGSNVSIIAAALISALRFLPRFICGVIALTCMSFFALMTGAAPPVVRSVLMSSIPLTVPLWIDAVRANASSKDPDALNNNPDGVRAQLTGLRLLCLTGYLMCLFNPMFPIYDISFQLSFMATLGLVLYTKPIEKQLARIAPYIPSKFGVREIIASSLGTQIMVAPILLQISGSVSTVFLAANILVLPILPLAMLCIFIASLSSFIIPAAAGAAGFVSWIFMEWILRITDLFSGISFASVQLVELKKGGVLLYYAIVLGTTSVLVRGRAMAAGRVQLSNNGDAGIDEEGGFCKKETKNDAPT